MTCALVDTSTSLCASTVMHSNSTSMPIKAFKSLETLTHGCLMDKTMAERIPGIGGGVGGGEVER